jgi:oxygen-independent coproporphyrinogen-3 oxidase
MAAATRVPTAPELLAAPAPRPDTVGLYLHVPFCARLCPYCDFDTQDHDLQLIAPYADALVREVALAPAARVHSIFFGGGTPSLLRPEQLAAVLEACRARFVLEPNCEITVECNPNNVREARLAGYRAAGVNRLSLGVQSMDDGELRLLGRQHTAARVRQAVATARAVGYGDLSLDLMYGLPGQTVADWVRTLDAALALAPEHLSCYLLTLDEESTPMGQQVARGEALLPDDEVVAAQYEVTRTRLAAAGMRQYEISNWARPGRESRHNLGYWRAEPYLGLGPGAVSCVGGGRRKQTPVVADYLAAIAAGRQHFVEEEPLDAATSRREALMLGLRLRAGVDASAYGARFGCTIEDVCGAALDELAAAGFVEWLDGRLRLAERAVLVSNEVLVRLGLA